MVQYDVKRVTQGAENSMVSFDFTKTPITQVADYIIIAASKNKASDIHFDPRDEGMMVRFRIDGDCQDYTYIPKAFERNLTTRLKLLANMNITETRLPQDGAIKGEFGDTYLDMRVACLPTNRGEKIVIRILDYSRSLQGVETLGFHPKNLEKIYHMMGVPNGIILVTGATGSGKSTTTYSMLSALNKPEVNVITVEDPVEMNIEGINQVQVNAEIGMTFAAALRSILREDPNVILIGEIRDSETAQIAVRASITGHLVMSTLHTNNALATVERLLDMDVERYLLSTALTGIISQRLAKQLCPDCRVQREPTPYEKKVYKKFLHKDVNLVWDANHTGCENCRKGYKGRLAVHEVLLLDDKIRSALNDDKMTKEDFSKMIYSGNTISMLQDALIKSLEGKTSFEEVYKTIEIENEDEDNYKEELEGINIADIGEENKEEIITDEDLIGEETIKDSALVEKYEIPGITADINISKQTQPPIEHNPTTTIEETTPPTASEETVVPTKPPITEETIPTTINTQIDQIGTNSTIQEDESTEQTTENKTSSEQAIDNKQQDEEEALGYKIIMPDEQQTTNKNEFDEEIPIDITESTVETIEPNIEPETNNNNEIKEIQTTNQNSNITNSIIEETNEENEIPTTEEEQTEEQSTTLTSIPTSPELVTITPIVDETENTLENIKPPENDKPIEVAKPSTTNQLTEIPATELYALADDDDPLYDDDGEDETDEDTPVFNQPTLTQNNKLVENVQNGYVVAEVADQIIKETNTGSIVLADPGIRIAADGSINQSANINAEPILPNYEE